MTVLNQRVIILVFSEAKAFNIRAEAELFIKTLCKEVDRGINAVAIFLQNALGIKVRDTFAAHASGEHILMGINKSINAGIAKFVDQSLNLVEIGIIILAFNALNAFPHDTEADKVHAPFFEIGDILVIQGELAVKLSV